MSWLVRKTYDYFLSLLGFAGNLCILTAKWVRNVKLFCVAVNFSFDHGQTKA